jgi:L-ascorbate metabolism protein UlaG (beta-lactamase superfamily)
MDHQSRITYIGHATTLIEIDGRRILTDPILRQRVWHLRRQLDDYQDDWHENLDAVLISHLHWDHLDVPSLRRIGRQISLIVPKGSEKLFKREGFRHIQGLRVGQETRIGSVTVQATYADHDGSRPVFGPKADSIGYLIHGRQSQQTIYFPGDTDLFPGMTDLSTELDVALMPVWGWGPTLGSGHMNPHRAAQSLKLLSPRLAIPIHWGTLFPLGLDRVMPRFLTEPPVAFATYANQYAPEVDVHILPPGAHLSWGGPV